MIQDYSNSMTRPLPRIVFITNNSCSVWAGSDELWSLAALHLARSGVPVLACVQNWRQQHSRIAELRAAGATIHVIRPKRAARLREKLHTLLHGGVARDLPLITVDEAIVRFRPDLVVISQMQNYDGAHWARACRARQPTACARRRSRACTRTMENSTCSTSTRRHSRFAFWFSRRHSPAE